MTQRPGYTATYDVIDKLDDYLPPDPAHRNAIIWRAVQAALDAEDREVVNPLRADLDHAERDNRRLQAAIDRIREHHRPGRTGENDGPWCNACNNPADLIINGPRVGTVRWPCPTIRILEQK